MVDCFVEDVWDGGCYGVEAARRRFEDGFRVAIACAVEHGSSWFFGGRDVAREGGNHL